MSSALRDNRRDKNTADRLAGLFRQAVFRDPVIARYAERDIMKFFRADAVYASSAISARRVITKIKWHPGELFPKVGFIIHLQLRLIRIEVRGLRHAYAVTFQLAEVAATGPMVRAILAAIPPIAIATIRRVIEVRTQIE